MENLMQRIVVSAAALAFACPLARAAWTTTAPFGDHMVIQAGESVTLTGKNSGTNKRLSCTIGETTVWTYGIPNAGDFSFVFPPLKAGGPYEVVISNETSGATLVVHDVMIGEVWLAAGQSNMGWTMKDAHLTYDQTNEMVRIYRDKKWVVATPESVANQTAEGFWFAETLQRKHGGAVGILSVGVGGTYIPCWLSHGAAKACPATRILLDDFERNQGDPARWAEKQSFEYDEPERSRVQKNPPPPEKRAPEANPWGDGAPWSRNYRWGVHRNYRPCDWYRAWIEPLTSFPVRGAFWHQGESEAGAAKAVADGYGEALKALIADWRHQWGQPDMPFGIIRIHDYDCGEKGKAKWKSVQEAQEAVAREVPNCGFIETRDIGSKDNIHFPNKKPVGERLAAWALRDVYGMAVEDAAVAAAAARKAAITNAVAEELTHEVRPGGVTQRGFWNANAMRFMYPPSIEFLPVAGASSYEMTVIDSIGRKFSWTSADPVARLKPHWTELATGFVNLLVQSRDAKGLDLGKTQGRFFWKKAAFTGDYPSAARSHREAADKLYAYILDAPALRYFAEHGKPDPDYPLNCYPTKIHSAVIGAMLKFAKRNPTRADYAMKVARLSADYLIAGAASAGTPLAGFTQTFEGKNLAAKDYAGQSMNLYPANAAAVFIQLFRATKEAKYRDAAVRIGETYLRLQGEDGTWPLKQFFADGKLVCPNRAFPLGIATMLEELFAETGRKEFRTAADRAFAYIEKGPLTDWDWEGQFEDVEPMPKYGNLTKHSACSTALYCLKRYPGDKRRIAEARDVLRFAEDQFVEWERPFVGIAGRPHQWGVNAKLTWMMDETHIRKAVYPSVLEQYRCYVPISSSSSKLISTYLALYKAEGKALDLEKAKALGDAMTRAQRPDGSIPTTLDPAAPYSGDWLNCLIADAAALSALADAENYVETKKQALGEAGLGQCAARRPCRPCQFQPRLRLDPRNSSVNSNQEVR